jgi:hypothetical protein
LVEREKGRERKIKISLWAHWLVGTALKACPSFDWLSCLCASC